jgi:signal transduction histidine kinase
VLRTQIASDAARLDQRLQRVAADPEVRRRVLVEAPESGALREYLATEQQVLDLDYLCVLDTSGTVLADGAGAGDARAGRMPVDAEALEPARGAGPGFARLKPSGAAALDATAAIRYSGADVARLRGGLVLDSLRLAALREASGVELVLWGADGRLLASTLTDAGRLAPGAATASQWTVAGRSYRGRSDSLFTGGASVRIAGLVPTARADAALGAIRTTSIVLALLAIALAIVLGTAWSLQLSRPVERLAEFSQDIARGEWDQPLEPGGVRELRTLAEALERMREDLRAYRARLVAGERQAAYGQMARRVAHEIKNPLTPIAISAADLKRSFELQRPDFPQILEQNVRTIEQEVHALNALIREFSELGRFPPPRFARCEVRDLLADVGGLFAHDVEAGRLAVAPVGNGLAADIDREQVRRALVNLVQNALDASAPAGAVRLRAVPGDGVAELSVADDGPGLPPEQRAQLFTPGFTTKAHGSGLGLTIVERIVSEHGGTIGVESAPGRGTTITLRLPLTRGA